MADSKKKQVPLRLSESLYKDIAAWAEDDFRSVNGQIEYLLTECVRKRKQSRHRTEGGDYPHDSSVT
ncbi:MAG TPA: PTS ascorbate transporter subunit IIC [Firmicutes bacterium]|nr:PTS ascorbate transporter subunit IIC [Bacillota bacterium]